MTNSFRTEVRIDKPSFSMTHQSPILMIGSCFSDNIGIKLEHQKFNILRNPFGVLYNPISIANSIQMVLDNIALTEHDLVLHNNLWHSFAFHGSFSNTNKQSALDNMNSMLKKCVNYISSTETLVVTFGTAWVYKHKIANTIVSNCHKLPEQEFTRYQLTIDEITQTWAKLINKLRSINPSIKIIFTISPIRHFKDGIHQNQVSKSILFVALNEIQNKIGYSNCFYFPSYEIIMDELRDYRFYSADMIHISDVAVNYIYERFKETFFSTQTIAITEELSAINHAYEHRILSNNNTEIQKFAFSFLKKIENFENRHPDINLENEKKYFKKLSEIQDS